MKISIIGLGYVGGAMQKVLSRTHEVATFDIDASKNSTCHTLQEAISFADTFLLCLPTDYSDKDNKFNTVALDQTIASIHEEKPNATLIIKSTVPMGYCSSVKKKYPGAKVFFSPEFLRESKAVEDAFHPTRIVVGSDEENLAEAKEIGEAFLSCLETPSPLRFLSLEEAEAVKLFSNAYLALRISFFNELDSYALEKGLSSASIIDAVGLDPRIGSHYCNPSFGYGGYCLPKDTKQLKANYKDVPENLISAVLDSNATRKRFIADEILKRIEGTQDPLVLIHRLRMETSSSSFRYTCLEDIIVSLKERGITPVIYEPLCTEDTFEGCPFVHDLEEQLKKATIIVTNRMEEILLPYKEKVFTRDKNY